MPIQLVACAPSTFFKNCIGINGKTFSREFVERIETETGVRIPISSRKKGIREDLWASQYDRLTEVLDKLGRQDLSRDLGGDLCIPSDSLIRKNIAFSWSWYSGKASSIYTISTAVFRLAMEVAEPLIIQNLQDYEDPLSHFDLFGQAIQYSEKHLAPILWSV